MLPRWGYCQEVSEARTLSTTQNRSHIGRGWPLRAGEGTQPVFHVGGPNVHSCYLPGETRSLETKSNVVLTGWFSKMPVYWFIERNRIFYYLIIWTFSLWPRSWRKQWTQFIYCYNEPNLLISHSMGYLISICIVLLFPMTDPRELRALPGDEIITG